MPVTFINVYSAQTIGFLLLLCVLLPLAIATWPGPPGTGTFANMYCANMVFYLIYTLLWDSIQRKLCARLRLRRLAIINYNIFPYRCDVDY